MDSDKKAYVLGAPVGVRYVQLADGTMQLEMQHPVFGGIATDPTEVWIPVPVVKESELPPQA